MDEPLRDTIDIENNNMTDLLHAAQMEAFHRGEISALIKIYAELIKDDSEWTKENLISLINQYEVKAYDEWQRYSYKMKNLMVRTDG